MTAVCLGGTSSARPGFGAFVYMGPSAIGALLNNIPTIWAVPLAATIGLITFELSTFCTDDPPAMPTFTASDVVDLLNHNDIVRQIAAGDKFRDMIGAFMWPTLCQCDTTSTPAIPAAPAEPTGMPSVNPVTPNTPDPTLATPCVTFPQTSRDFGGAQVFPTTDPYNVVSGMTGFFMRFAWHPSAGAVAVNFHYTVTFQDAGRSTISTTAAQLVIAGFSDYTLFWQIPPGAEWFVITWGTPSTTSHGYFTLDIDGYCGGTQPGGSITGCCPPDPVIEQLLTNIQATVTLIQRQSVPFSYVPGGDHSGLTGSGHIDVQGLLGCKVTLDSIGGGTGTESADPDEVFEAGWITWGNADGSTKREWISHSPFVSLPALGGQYTRIGYTLRAGVTATITELVREA